MSESKPVISVLIVDDNAEDRETYRRLIARDEDTDYVFTEADTGETGLAICLCDPPDCLLLDYRLPDLDGLVFLTKLFGDRRRLRIPVVMLTAAAERELGLEAVRRGAQDFLIKGETGSGALNRSIRHAVERHRWFEDQSRRRAWRERSLSARTDLFPAAFRTPDDPSEGTLRERSPGAFADLERRYLELTAAALTGHLFQDAKAISTELRRLARDLVSQRAGPRDVLDLHVASLTQLAAAETAPPAANGDDARLMALELMGHLAARYRAAAAEGGGGRSAA